MIMRVLGAMIALCSIAAGPEVVSQFKAVTFADPTPLARNDEMIRRLFSPFAAADLARENGPAALGTFPVIPKDERFGLYVPKEKPGQGYALLVWVSPLDEAGIPPGWPEVLESRGVIFVTAARSGNLTSPIGRRFPLALIAAANVQRLYPVDPNRIWIAGFSGGSRIAERLALAYPDVFSGAILDGSSDDIGSADVPLPPRANFERVLDQTAIVFSSGEKDAYNVEAAEKVASSLRRHCFDRLSVEVRRNEGHVIMNGRSLAKAIDFLDRPREQPSPGDRQCREKLYSKIDGELVRADALVQRRGQGARGAIDAIDRRYGWLAAPRSLDLRARVDP
jgi:dienelactone hydrolase